MKFKIEVSEVPGLAQGLHYQLETYLFAGRDWWGSGDPYDDWHLFGPVYTDFARDVFNKVLTVAEISSRWESEWHFGSDTCPSSWAPAPDLEGMEDGSNGWVAVDPSYPTDFHTYPTWLIHILKWDLPVAGGSCPGFTFH